MDKMDDIVTVAKLLGQPDLSFRDMAAKLQAPDLIKKIEEADEKELHLAVEKYRLELMKQLAELVNLCDCASKGGEAPLKMAVRLGFNEAVEFLLTRTSNALHYIVELNQVKLIEYLMEREVDLSKVINEPYQLVTNQYSEQDCATNPSNPKRKSPTNASGDEGENSLQSAAGNKSKTEEKESSSSTNDKAIVLEGDMPLDIAARNKYEHMMNLLLKVHGVNKLARYREKKTPFQIAREVTEYHESFWIIRKLAYDRRKPKPFMFCAPEVSHKKFMLAKEKVDETYEARRNAELVVAALLATMTCAAAFTVPGGFNSDSSVKVGEGSPLLIGRVSFKLFIIFDCIAFFLSLFVCIMWEMSSELTTGNKMVFMSINSLLVCSSFSFTSYGFMAAVHSMLAHRVEMFSWVVLGCLSAITFCGIVVFIHHSLRFLVKRARFHRLCGVDLFLDRTVERVWCGAERCGFLDIVRHLCDDVRVDLSTGQRQVKEDQVSCKNSHSSRSCCFNHV